MTRARIVATLLSTALVALALAPEALARAYGGEGWYGETTDRTITYSMYIVIGFFPAVIIILSLLQWRLDRRKHAKLDATRRRAASIDWRGGW